MRDNVIDEKRAEIVEFALDWYRRHPVGDPNDPSCYRPYSREPKTIHAAAGSGQTGSTAKKRPPSKPKEAYQGAHYRIGRYRNDRVGWKPIGVR